MRRPARQRFPLCLTAAAAAAVLLSVVAVGTVRAGEAPAEAEAAARRGAFVLTRLIAHWSDYGGDDYLTFVEDARPDVCQVGFYGGHFYSLAHTAEFAGYPAHLPVQGLAECGRWFEQRNAAIHQRNAKVVGHFNMTFLVGEPGGGPGRDEPRGFFKFYRDLWDEQELGPRPVADPLELLARNADGTPMSSNAYSIGGMREFTACLVNPHWQAVLKAWAKRGIERGVDGFVVNYFYRHNCLCPHCQAGFRAHLTGRFTPAELAAQFAISDLAAHRFTEIVGWHNPKESTPLRREMLRWSQTACKAAFDEVFVRYARSLKPGLLLAQWNHLGDFNQLSGDERCLLPPEMWGRDEDYAWYSTGGITNASDLPAGVLGEATLQARYVRGAFGGKPYTLGKYESVRVRLAIAELAANGGAPMGFYTNFRDPDARAEIVRYYRFMEHNDAAYRGARSHAEVLLLYPRTRVHAGDVASVDAFRKRGKDLLDRHVLFDVLPDDSGTPAIRAAYRAVLDVAGDAALAPPAALPGGLSRFDAPATVRVSASRPSGDAAAAGEITLHLVNYDREEPAHGRAADGILDEKPKAAPGVAVDLALPAGATVKAVRVSTPESPDAVEVAHTTEGDRLRFTTPPFLVYSIARVQLAER